MISSLVHIVALRPRVYYTLTNFRGGGSQFLFKVISKYTPKRINRETFPNISLQELPQMKRVSKIFTFYINNSNFLIFLKTKSDPNIHQNEQNCKV